MVKKFIKNYGFYVVAVVFTIIVFAVGYTVGKMNIKTVAIVEVEQTENTIEESISEKEPVLIDLGEFELTAYDICAKCCGKTDGITATGTHATAGRTVAVDPNVIPYGTEIIINGHTYIAEDTGGAMKGNKIDICVSTHEEALNFGVQHAHVYKAP